MVALILDAHEEKRLIDERRARGGDRYDEVWEGVYVMSPFPNYEHQLIASKLMYPLQLVVSVPGLGDVLPGVNVSDRDEGWEHNYRVPDIAVFLKTGTATIRDTHTVGGPDFAVEILSPNDRTREKIDFYASVGTRELLIVDRDPWALELYRLQAGQLVLAGTSDRERSQPLASAVVPLAFRLVAGEPRPRIEIVHAQGAHRWIV